MKVMVVKPKKMLLYLFEKQGGRKDSDGNWKIGECFFVKEMFDFCGKEIEVQETESPVYDFRGKDWHWRKEWLVPMSLKEDKHE